MYSKQFKIIKCVFFKNKNHTVNEFMNTKHDWTKIRDFYNFAYFVMICLISCFCRSLQLKIEFKLNKYYQ